MSLRFAADSLSIYPSGERGWELEHDSVENLEVKSEWTSQNAVSLDRGSCYTRASGNKLSY